MTVIDSPRNAAIQAAIGLRDRRDREATGMTLVDGARECYRAVASGVAVETAFICRDLVRPGDGAATIDALRSRGARITEVSQRAFERLAFGDRADGIVLVVRPPEAGLATLAARRVPGRDGSTDDPPLLLVTEDVEKPGNLGAILRTADAAGVSGVIAIGGTDLWNPNVIRASVGTVFSVPVAASSADEAIAWLRGQAIRIVAARVEAPFDYAAADLTGPLALVLGSEAEGLSAAWHGPGIEGIHLPMHGIADSLNVSATAAILAYEARRQRTVAGGTA
ncbi:MAG: TrmH family RNA methyltransferase [Candidatus Limnocylindrales bacterium]